MRRDLETETDVGSEPAKVAPALPRDGDVIDRKYRVEKHLGRGGMGTVLLVAHEHLGTRHAMKLLAGETWKDEPLRQRFLREAQAAATLRSRHIVKVTDFGFLAEGAPYMVMEHLEGRDLRHVLVEEGPLAPDLVARCLAQACDALAEAHSRGIIHRDLKPSNLFLTQDDSGTPCVKVLDFGIAKVPLGASHGGHASTAGFFGTAPYVSPEQIRSTKDVDPRADVWSLGVTAYELLTGALPFEGDTSLETFAKILEDAPLPPSRRRPDLAAGWDDVVMGCLNKDRHARTPDVATLKQQLLSLTAAPSDAAAPVPQAPSERQPSPAKISARVHTDASWSDATMPTAAAPRRTRAWVIAGALFCALGALWLVSRGPHDPEGAKPPSSAPAVTTAPLSAAAVGAHPSTDSILSAAPHASPATEPASSPTTRAAPSALSTSIPSARPKVTAAARPPASPAPGADSLPNLPTEDQP